MRYTAAAAAVWAHIKMPTCCHCLICHHVLQLFTMPKVNHFMCKRVFICLFVYYMCVSLFVCLFVCVCVIDVLWPLLYTR